MGFGKFGKGIGVTLLCVAMLFVSMPLSPANAASSILVITPPVFASVAEGYSQPEAQPVTLQNVGQAVLNNIDVSVSGDSFLLKKPEGAIWLFGGAVSKDYQIGRAHV